MSLSSLYLDAFTEVARLKSFSQAAAKLNVTQSALSQRVLNLESDLGSTLFIRDPGGLRLTDLGQRLLRYCHSKAMLEDEFMESFKSSDLGGLKGLIRIGGFSTVNRSVVMPLFSGFLKDNPAVNLELRTEELRDLPPLLFTGAADMIFVCEPPAKNEIQSHLVGFEEYVLVQSPLKSAHRDIYLDNDEHDTTTADFFKAQGKKEQKLKRNFLGDIYSIIDGVRLGMGRAVVPLHLIHDVKGVEVVKGHTSMKVPVYLCYYNQAFFTELQKRASERILADASKFLGLS